MKEIPSCREEYTCDAHRTRSLGDYARKHIAADASVYTYNIGSYEGGMRDDDVPCVPSNVDAFLFLDDDTKERSDSNSLNTWKKLGWQIKSVTLQAGSEFVTGARLTSKLLKFTPPSWLLQNGEWEWLVEFDGNVVLDLHTLGPFLDKYTSKPLLLMDWSYHDDCGDDGFQCFSKELHNMLHSRRKYIEDSKENVEAWLPDRSPELESLFHRRRKYTPPYYYETRVIVRNLQHHRRLGAMEVVMDPKMSDEVTEAFGRTYEKCHEIQRDAWPMLGDGHANLSFDTEALPMRYLADSVARPALEVGSMFVLAAQRYTAAWCRGWYVHGGNTSWPQLNSLNRLSFTRTLVVKPLEAIEISHILIQMRQLKAFADSRSLQKVEDADGRAV
eukprot:Skav215535  [mRNA]  locus=scaffold4176:38234:41837:- [translate_table: standard]